MRTILIGLACLPVWALAQAPFATDFPGGAAVVAADDLQKKLTGRVFQMKYANGTDVRLEFKDTYAYVNSGSSSDSGKWRTEGSKLCIEWQRFPSGCSEVRTVAEALYLKRFANGEIVQLVQK